MDLFGTDGIRGSANIYPMTASMAVQIGMACAVYLKSKKLNKTNRVIIGKDTRKSGYMFEYALVSGFASMGIDVLLLGPMPTPAIAMLTCSIRADLGIMISASHNPFYDNGIKIFNNNGYKLSSEDEQIIENLIKSDLSKHLVIPGKIGKVKRLSEASGRYIQYVKSVLLKDVNFTGCKIVIDCANGAAYKIAPIVFYELGADVISIGVDPDGININKNCGSTHLDQLRSKVLEEGANLGIAYDGDADRVILIDEKGNIVNGDKILATLAVYMKEYNELTNDSVVCTIMSNLGLQRYLKSKRISCIEAQVGDKYVSRALLQNGLSLGGEESGHIIMPKYSTTGDGILASLKLVEILKKKNDLASVVFNPYKESPQVVQNITYNSLNPLDIQSVSDSLAEYKDKYKDKYKIVVRKSGTEKLVRIMVQGEDSKKILDISNKISRIILKSIY